MIAAIGEAIIVTSLEGRILNWNPAAERMYGWQAGEVLTRPIAEVLPTRFDDPAESSEQVMAAVLGEGLWRGMVIHPRKDGVSINVASTVTLLCDAGRQPTGMVSINRDITESKRLGAKLNRLEQMNRAISRGLTADEILAILIAEVQDLITFDWVSLILFTADAATYEVRAAVNRDQPRLAAGQRAPLSGSLLARVRLEREPLIVPDIRERDFGTRPLLEAEGVRSLLLLPLIIGAEVIGAINFSSYQAGAYTRRDAELLTATAEQVAIALNTARLLENLQRAESQMRDLSLQLIRAQEEERGWLAHELHDEVGQTLTILKLNLQSALAALAVPGNSPPPSVAESLNLVNSLLDQIRQISLDLRPSLLDDLGLAPALRWYIDRAGQHSALAVRFEAPADLGRFAPDVETALFRIAQESVTNVLRHAQAKNLWVQLAQRAGCLELHITDDGVGFELPPGSLDRATSKTLGLSGLAKRAALIGAELEIDTAPGRGTHISVRVLLANDENSSGG